MSKKAIRLGIQSFEGSKLTREFHVGKHCIIENIYMGGGITVQLGKFAAAPQTPYKVELDNDMIKIYENGVLRKEMKIKGTKRLEE
jgi:hypothetical protein